MSREHAAVAIVGGSPERFYTKIVRANLGTYGKTSDIFLVNPRLAASEDPNEVGSVAEIPTEVTLGIVQLRAELVQKSVEELVAKGCRTIVVFSDGFADKGTDEGRRLQDALAETVRDHGVTLVGPNSMGYADVTAGLVSIAGPITDQIRAGRTSIISDSGALLSSMLSLAADEGLGIDRAISVGNGASMPTAAWIEDAYNWPTTDNLWVYSEGLHGEIGLLEEAIRRFVAEKGRISWYLSGVSDAGQRAARSHTGRMTPPQSEALTFLDDLGVIVFDSLDVMARGASLPESIACPAAPGIAVLSSSGGGGVAGADACAKAGVPLAEITSPTDARVSSLLGEGFHATNPFDFTAASGDIDTFAQVLDAFAADESVGALVYAFPVQLPHADELGERHMAKLEALASTARADLPVVVSTVAKQVMPAQVAELVDKTEHFSVAPGLDLTFRGIAALRSGGGWHPRRAVRVGGDSQGVNRSETRSHDVEIIEEARALDILDRAGLQTVPMTLVHDPQGAVAAADAWDGPVVVKGVARGLAHKQGAGLVAVGLYGRTQVRPAAERILEILDSRAVTDTQDPPDGPELIVQPLIRGLELFLAARRTQLTGGIDIVFGLGGTLAEVSDHVAVGSAPAESTIDAATATAFVCAAGLEGLLARLPEPTAASIADAMRVIVGHARDPRHRDVDLVELNPLMVTEPGLCVAVDALVIRRADDDRGVA